MASVEATGITVDDAIDAALDELDLDEEDVDLEILAEGAEGQPARVRATARLTVSAPGAEAETETETETEHVGADEEPSLSIEIDDGPWDGDLATAAREILEDLLDYMGFPGDVEVIRAGKQAGTPTVAMTIVGGDSMGALIGRRGETLQALQFISQLLVNRRVGHWTRVVVDIEGYRLRRERYLKDAALRAAQNAMRYREPVELDPMIPSERRIVHMTLAEHESVATHSEGEGDHRRVIVEPKPEFVREHGGPDPSRPRPTGQGGGFGRGAGGGAGGRGRSGFGGRFSRR